MNLERGNVRLEARGVNFAYAHPVIQDLSLRLPAGLVTGIIGPNGSGKTTVLRLLDGILKPESGEVLLDEVLSLGRLSRKEIARRIAMVPQNGGEYFRQSVYEFAMRGRSPHLSLMGFESPRDEEIVLEALAMTQMTPHLEAQAAAISGGEKQRLLLARALAQQPEVLLLDEFTANLDINFQIELLRLVRRITRERNLATLIVSHEINLLAAFSDRVVLMIEGRILQQGLVTDVITQANLKKLFGLDFWVRSLPGDVHEVLPVMNEGRF